MEYTVELDGNIYDLPKYTLAIADKISVVEKIPNSRLNDKCKKMYDFIRDLLGKDTTESSLGKYKDIDPNQVTLMFESIVRTYKQPIEDSRAELARERLEGSQIKEITQMLTALNGIDKGTLQSILDNR